MYNHLCIYTNRNIILFCIDRNFYLEDSTSFFFFASRLTTILNQSDNSDETDSGEDIDCYSEGLEVLDSEDDGETALTDE